MALQAADIDDLILTTQKELGKLKWTEIATDLQEHIILPQILKKEKVQFDSGYEIQWNIMHKHSESARHVGLYAKDVVNTVDVMTTGGAPWRHCTDNYAYDRRELAMNRNPAKIVDEVKKRRAAAMISLASTLETAGWAAPSSSTDTTEPYGITYWIVRNATEGFNGGAPSGFTTVGGVNPSTYTRWKNYTAQYTNVTKADLIKKWRRASYKTNFMSPLGAQPNSDYNRGNRYVYYTTYNVRTDVEDLGEAQNENLGKDIASMDGQILFRRNPIVAVPQLDNDSAVTYAPIYGINWGVFFPVFLEGEYLREDPPTQAPEQHTVSVVYIDLTWNMKCTDRRRLFVLATSA